MSNVNFIFNPFTTKLEIVKGPSAQSIVRTYGCSSTTIIGDLVYFNPSVGESVLPESGNVNVNPVIGIVINKLSIEVCEVMLQGVMTGFLGLSIGKKVFLSNSGFITDSVVTSGYLQSLGVASDDDTISFNPNYTRVLRV